MENEKLTDELEHHGIKGMRWGIRRYQTENGKLTPAGRKRYNQDLVKLKEKNAKLDAKIKNKSAEERAKARIQKLKDEAEAKKNALREDKESAKAEKKAAKEAAKTAKAAAAKEKKNREIEESLANKTKEFEAEKAKILRSQDPQKILDNAHLFNNQELNDAANRLATEARIKGLVPEKISKGAEIMNKTVDVTKKVSDIANNVSGIYDKASSLYNIIPESVKTKWGLKTMTLPKISGNDTSAKEAAEKARTEYVQGLSKKEARKVLNTLSKSEIEYLNKKFKADKEWAGDTIDDDED